MLRKNKKLGVIVPYRDRESHLKIFQKRISRFLDNEKIPHEIIVVCQDNGKLFNRGMLLNIGFKYAEKLNCDYVVFHDVDMIPMSVDYSYCDKPIHLATELTNRDTGENSDDIFDEYFGGVTMFPIDQFKQIDGYSNKYWGWGYEDNDLLLRSIKNNIPLDTLKIKNINIKGTKLKLNGVNAYIKSKNFNNLLNFNSDLTLFVSFYPDEIYLDHTKEIDNFTVFSILGFNTSISYNSFQRYNFCSFDQYDEPLYINSKIKTNYKTSICVTFDYINKKIEMYQDGELIGYQEKCPEIHDYVLEQFFYLGCSVNSDDNNDSFFKGYLDRFAVYDKKLDLDEIKYISTTDIVLTQNIEKYTSATKMKVCYDSNFIKNYKLVDISGNDNDGIIYNCEIVECNFDEYKEVKIPFRRNSSFQTLSHDNNGFENNKWKKSETRWNQLRFHNEVSKNDELLKNDGLSTLIYITHGKENNNNVTKINVGI
jgi:hypothetical protein